MRATSKPGSTGKPGISAANAYVSSVKSAATDLEAFADAFELTDVVRVLVHQKECIQKFGACDHARELNAWLIAQPRPKHRKSRRSIAKAKTDLGWAA